jgi:hypothetical protein
LWFVGRFGSKTLGCGQVSAEQRPRRGRLLLIPQ